MASILCMWNSGLAKWVPIGRGGSDGLVLNQLSIGMDSPDSLAFTQLACRLPGEFRTGNWVNLTVDGTVVFIGQIVSLHPAGIGRGQISIGYRCYGLNWLINQLWITSINGVGTTTFNLPEDDPNYVASMSGLNVGQIITYLYNTMLPNFNSGLNFPVAAFTGMLFSSSDLAALTIVPPISVTVTGRLWNSVSEILNQWCNNVGAWITPLGVGGITAGGYYNSVQATIRHENMMSLPVYDGAGVLNNKFVLDALDGNGTVCSLDSISEDFSECYTQVAIRGAGDIQGANLSLAGGGTLPNAGATAYPSSWPGTLVYGWSAGQQAAWNYNSYLNPPGAYEQGTISSMTSTTLTVSGATPSPTYTSTSWWSSLGAEVWAYFPTGGSTFFNEQRRITANTAPSGGAYTLTVDVPFANTGYTNYVIRGRTSFQGVSTMADVWRKFLIVPQYVANSMVQMFSHSVPWTGGVAQAVVQTMTPMANVSFPNAGNAISWPMTFQIVPFGTGLYTVQATATATVGSGAVTGYTSLVGGSGYSPSTNLAVQVVSTSGSGALVFAVTNSSGVVTSLVVQNGGSGYSSAPTLEIGVNSGYIEFYQPICSAYCSQAQLNGTGLATNPTDLQVLVPYSTGPLQVIAPLPTASTSVTISVGVVTAISVVSGGSGYPLSSTTIPVEVFGGGGAGCMATATSNGSGVITSVTVSAGGTGYYSPPSVWIMQFAGTAYTVNGVQRTWFLDYPEWLDYGQAASYQALANQRLLTVMNTIIEGSLTYYGKAAPFFVLGNALNITGNGYTTGYEAISAAAKSVVIDWLPTEGATQWTTRINFSTRMKPFSGDRLYAHPNYLAAKGLGYSTPWGDPTPTGQKAALLTGGIFGSTDFSGGIGGAMARAGDMALGTDTGAGMSSTGLRGVTIDDVNRKLQQDRRDERIEQQRLQAQQVREGRHQEGPPAPVEYPFADMNTPQPDSADIAQAIRRKRANDREARQDVD